MTRVVLFSLALISASLTACVTTTASTGHAIIPRAPQKEFASFDERAAYYKRYALDARDDAGLFLHGGTRVAYVEDLVPAVDEDSTMVAAVHEHVEARKKVEAWSWLDGAGSLTAGTGLALMPLAVAPLLFSKDIVGPISPWSTEQAGAYSIDALLVGSGLAVIGGAALLGDWMIVGDDQQKANDAADRAVRLYPQALVDRLGVSADAAGRIVDDAGRPTMAPPAPAIPVTTSSDDASDE